jgi:pyridoxine 5-phosphate synthase
MTKLSVNINKVATIRNARGGNVPNVVQFALDCEKFGAQGITVHPRPDERHIRYQDVRELKPKLTTEFNIEGYPSRDFMDMVLSVQPHQVTLVPDPPEAITSNAGWDAIKHKDYLSEVVKEFQQKRIRVSIFMETDFKQIEAAKKTGTNRIELYTEQFATTYPSNKERAIYNYVLAADYAHQIGLGINAGHDLSLENLQFFASKIPFLDEVSIGHALISDALYLGLEKTIHAYLNALKK